jgi:8-amino-7-oxononanoate synthase
LAAQLPVRVVTFGKAIGAHGACILGSKTLCQFLVNFGRSFIYSTAPPAHTLLQVQHNLRWLAAHPQHRQQLQQVIEAYRAEAAAVGFGSQLGAIQTLILPGETAKQAEQLLQPQFNVRAIVAPTVAAGSERLRICLHSFNTVAQVRELFAKLSPLLREHKHRCV